MYVVIFGFNLLLQYVRYSWLPTMQLLLKMHNFFQVGAKLNISITIKKISKLALILQII